MRSTESLHPQVFMQQLKALQNDSEMGDPHLFEQVCILDM